MVDVDKVRGEMINGELVRGEMARGPVAKYICPWRDGRGELTETASLPRQLVPSPYYRFNN